MTPSEMLDTDWLTIDFPDGYFFEVHYKDGTSRVVDLKELAIVQEQMEPVKSINRYGRIFLRSSRTFEVVKEYASYALYQEDLANATKPD